MRDPEYFERFFEEKQLPFQCWSFPMGDTLHVVDSDVVIANIKSAPPAEQAAVRAMLVRIDFANGDVNHYLKHLAECMVNVWEADRLVTEHVNSN